MEKLREADKTSNEIENLRNLYRAAAKRGAVLFFVLSDMASINTMYQYSLNSYLDLFKHSLKKSNLSNDVKKRVKNIIETLTGNVYHYACTGLFEVHKLLFSFQMTIKIQVFLFVCLFVLLFIYLFIQSGGGIRS